MKNLLQGKKLKVISITRQNILDADYVGCCNNCGKMIVNIARVESNQVLKGCQCF